MASKSKHTAELSERTRSVGVIEMRDKGKPHGVWRLYPDFIIEPPREDSLAWACSSLAERLTEYEFRYRAATLTFDDDGRKCTIYWRRGILKKITIFAENNSNTPVPWIREHAF